MIKNKLSLNNKYYFKTMIICLFLFQIIFLSSCGNRKNPTGGPEDNVKPVVMNVIPSNLDQINNNEITFTFSKLMDQTSFNAGIQFYPPISNKKLTWNKNTLTIKIKEKLKDNCNYFVTLNNMVKCYHGNSLEKSVTYIFRNGNLNDYEISGTFSYENNQDKLLEKKIIILDKDSLLIHEQSITDNSFIINHLNNQELILRSYIDKNNNNSYDYSKEPYFQTLVNPDFKRPLDIVLAYSDTLKPDIKQIKSLSSRDIEITFTKNLNHIPFTVFYDENSSSSLKIIASELTDNKVHYITSSQDTVKYNAIIKQMMDKKGNEANPKEAFFQGTNFKSNESPHVVSSSIRNGVAIYDVKPVFNIKFSEIILKNNLLFSMIEVETKKEIPLKIIKSNSIEWQFTTEQNLKPFNSYLFKIDKNSKNHFDVNFNKDFEFNFLVKDKSKK